MEWNQIFTALPGMKKAGLKINHDLCTIWGEEIRDSYAEFFKEPDKNGASLKNTEIQVPLEEYPRPQLVRKNFEGQYQSLNGIWKYAIVKNHRLPEKYDGNILVPFSPETMLSGVERQVSPGDFLWYEKKFRIQKKPGMRLLLHIQAADQAAIVYLNGKRIIRHAGGYLPFYAEITDEIREGKNTLRICVQDVTDTSYRSRGKQKLKSGGMFYTAQSGIWQSVWLEWVPQTYIESVRITPLYEEHKVDIKILLNGRNEDSQTGAPGTLKETVLVKAFEPVNGLLLSGADAGDFCDSRKSCHSLIHEPECVNLDRFHRECHILFEIPDMKSWTPQTPYLYGIGLEVGEDSVLTYTAMRIVSVEKREDGVPVICLNHKPYFMNGVLDQGYYPESLMTPPSEEAMLHDILTMKDMGFNMLRKHCKIEPERWYFHCDRLGMLVWQDMVNGGTSYDMLKVCYLPTFVPGLVRTLRDDTKSSRKRGGRVNASGRRNWQQEMKETIECLYNHPSIVCWVLFNEGWGQFESKNAVTQAREIGGGRLIDAASGWFDQGAGDIRSEHNYFRRLTVKKEPERAFAITEYGGCVFREEGHCYSAKQYGYGAYKDKEAYAKALSDIQEKIGKLKEDGLCAAVYTQVSDIEEEQNGLMTYDRKRIKINPEGRKNVNK